jgi:hypothetical protein
MSKARYLPATRVRAGSLRLGRLSVRGSDGHEMGKLKGFILGEGERSIRSLVVEGQTAELEVPMTPMQVDATSRSLWLLGGSLAQAVPFAADRVPEIEESELWVPLFTTAA